jgi:hypothetical protein
MQLWPVLQVMHCLPAAPHAVTAVPTWQLPTRSLQPLHVWAAWHMPPEHSCPVVQALHTWPDLPHAVTSAPLTHLLSWQQPVQVLGLQLVPPSVPPPPPPDVVQAPAAEQVWPLVQATQATASRPHASAVLPTWQTPSASQQPLQLLRVQRAGGGVLEPQAGTSRSDEPASRPSTRARAAWVENGVFMV